MNIYIYYRDDTLECHFWTWTLLLLRLRDSCYTMLHLFGDISFKRVHYMLLLSVIKIETLTV